MINGEPWFCVADVARCLEYATNNMTAIVACVPDEWKGSNPIATPSGTQNMLCISEQGLYFLLGRSDKPKALPFQKWLAGEVLPSIRKHGMYALPSTVEELIANPDLIIQLATQWKIERLTRERLAQEKHALQVELDESKDWYSVKRVANINHVSWKAYPWGPLVSVSKAQGIPPRKIFDANYGEVNLYHRSIWEMVYPNAEL